MKKRNQELIADFTKTIRVAIQTSTQPRCALLLYLNAWESLTWGSLTREQEFHTLGNVMGLARMDMQRSTVHSPEWHIGNLMFAFADDVLEAIEPNGTVVPSVVHGYAQRIAGHITQRESLGAGAA